MMKKRMISIAVALTMLLSIGSAATAQESSDSVSPSVEMTASSAQIANQAADVVDSSFTAPTQSTQATERIPYRGGDVPAGGSVVDSITPPVSALVMCMLERELSYDQNDDSFYWNGLYYMLSLYGQMDSRAQLTDEMLILPAEAVADYAAALFTSFDGLPQLPQELEGRITYADGEYYLARGDAGLLTTQLSETNTQSDGSLLVTGQVSYVVEGDVLCDFVVKLQPNDGMFGYAISDAILTV